MAIADMEVQFAGLRPEDPPARVKVVGWGNLAQEMQSQYQMGDRVVIEGRLGMNTVDRPEGFKEKQAELTASKIYTLGAADLSAAPPLPAGVSLGMPTTPPAATSTRSKAPQASPPPAAEPDFDDIPF